MIQFNLLPDVKLQYVRAQQTKRTVMGAALISTAAAGALFLLLFLTVHGVQKKSISDLNKDIKQYSTELKETPDLNKILTIQNQLGALGGLHDQKHVASRTLPFLQQVTPADVTISDFKIDFEAKTVTITGQAPAIDRVNVFTDTLKFANYITGESSGKKPAFSGVVMTQFSHSETGVSYGIDASFDPELFSGAHQVSLEIPKTVTTRSVTEQPTDLFKQAPKPTNGQN